MLSDAEIASISASEYPLTLRCLSARIITFGRSELVTQDERGWKQRAPWRKRMQLGMRFAG